MERRTFVGSVARLTAGFAGLRWSELAAVSARASGIAATAAYQVLTPEQVRLLDVVTAHLVPTDDTPGAREAHVVRFIDTALGTILTDFREDFLKTLGAFDEFMSHYRPDGAPFLALSPNEQVDALGELERLAPETFGPIRSATMLGMFVHPEHGGNFRKVGWQLIGYVDQYSWAPPFGYYDRA